MDVKNVTRLIQPSFFGFNLEWVEFQRSLWDAKQGKAKKGAVEYLRAFPGAVYRYPGGTIANHFDWRVAAGAIESRPLRRHVDWLGSFKVEFGPEEYLEFVRDVGGKAWYVVNLYGQYGEELSSDEIAKSAGELAAYMRKRHEAGLPAVLRWELGNELDRGEYQWAPEKLNAVIIKAETEIKKHDNAAKFVAFLQDYPAMKHAGYSMSAYNSAIIKNTSNFVDEYANHLYYDGNPNIPPIPKSLATVCGGLEAAHAAGISTPTIWLTEHARVPGGAWVTPNWKHLWPATSDQQAAISVADMMMAAAQIPEINGAFVHALHATDGPWPLFHLSQQGEPQPSAVMIALRLLRESMLPVVLHGSIESQNLSGYEGGYDIRAAVMSDKSRKKYSLWVVNRHAKPVEMVITMPALGGKALSGKHAWLTANSLEASNQPDHQAVQTAYKHVDLNFDQSGNSQITLPPYSVSAYSLAIK